MNTASLGVKKGSNPRWKTGASLGMLNVPEGFKGRWVNNDDANITKKMQEGWEFVNKTTFPQVQHVKKHNQKDVKDSEGSTGGVHYRELVGMMLPIEDVHGTGQCVKEREAYYQQVTDTHLKSRVRAEKNQKEILGSELAGVQSEDKYKGKLTIIE